MLNWRLREQWLLECKGQLRVSDWSIIIYFRTKPSKHFVKQTAQRELHMDRYQKGELQKMEYMERMGAITLKAGHQTGKSTVQAQTRDASTAGNLAEKTLNDSFSETRPLPDPSYESPESDVEKDDPFLNRQKNLQRRAFIKPIVEVCILRSQHCQA